MTSKVQHDEVDISEGDILESDGLTEEWTEGKNITTGKSDYFNGLCGSTLNSR